ncbi:MAG: ferrous iron transport protein B [Treponema sp.]|jgi:ferrous iron transport protein B|nr:ferrous iron transport protein B [Treponema sp.]
MTEEILIALAGNTNSGKTTLFNALTGAHHKTGNYPGVTVEKREGVVKRGGKAYHFVDLPGIYSLTAYSEDEVVARSFILQEKPDVIIDVLDSTNLERNLYLLLQMRELGIPTAAALNMTDEADQNGMEIDEKQLAAQFGLPFVKITAQRGKGLDKLLDSVDRLFSGGAAGMSGAAAGSNAENRFGYGIEIEERLRGLQNLITAKAPGVFNSRWLAVKLLEKDKNAVSMVRESSGGGSAGAAIEQKADEVIRWIETRFGNDSEIVVSEKRYEYIRKSVLASVKTASAPAFALTKRLDGVFMNRFLALPLFLGILWGVFQITFTVGAYPQEWLEAFFGFLSGAVLNAMPSGLLRSLIVDGIIAGVGGVLSFVPLVVILFLLLSVLEDLGYMSRAAFATDKLLHAVGLHGQSIFPLMLGFGCSIPAVMASRTLKSRRDRIITVLVTPMMSCGAKLPIHLMMAAAFFPENAGNMVMLLYLCGVIFAILSALLLRHTVLKGDPTPFVMELPPYRLPTVRGILWHVFEKTWRYIKKAGSIILASAVLIWVITSFPAYEADDAEGDRLAAAYRAENPGAAEEDIEEYRAAIEADRLLEYSFAGRIGKAIEPVFKPLGFNWQMSVASITGFAAKEIVVSTLGILYHAGAEENEESETLRGALAGDPHLTPRAAFAFMLFMLLIPPCFAALATIKAELGWKWLGFECAFLLALGWLAAFAAFHIGSLL